MLGFLIITLIFLGALVGLSKMSDLDKVKNEWDKYRCRPDVMIMADYYGHDSTENLEFCLKSGFDKRARDAIGPFYTYLKAFVDILVTMLESLNSIRMVFATLVGSVTQVFSEFSSRIKALFYRFQMTAIRLKFLMGRVFASMYAVIFMGMSGIKATQNFSNTFLFKFLDTFCFDPTTPVLIKKKGKIPIRDVCIGDRFESGETVTATFAFEANGQSMVTIDGILVSTNHYILHKDKWIRADSHPDAVVAPDWAGGSENPLICLNTDNHSFRIGNYLFRDYDETAAGDKEAMELSLKMLNGGYKGAEYSLKNTTSACSAATLIKTADGLVPAYSIQLGTQLTQGRVIAVIRKESDEVCVYNGTRFAPGTAVWTGSVWERVGSLVKSEKITPCSYYSFVVSPSACIETVFGTMFRDYMEVHSPDMENPYKNAMDAGF